MSSAQTEGITNQLRAYFENKNEITFAFLFGSQAKKIDGDDSDVDIAVYFKPRNNELDLQNLHAYFENEHAIWNDIEKIIHKNVDLLVLNRASATIADSALRGIPIIIKDRNLFLEFLLRITSEAADFREWIIDFWKTKERMKSGVQARR